MKLIRVDWARQYREKNENWEDYPVVCFWSELNCKTQGRKLGTYFKRWKDYLEHGLLGGHY